MDIVASLKTVLSLLGDEGQGCDCQKCNAIRKVKDEIERLKDNDKAHPTAAKVTVDGTKNL